ncbi:MAG: hypothetical protein IJD52_01135 [Alphaproteobacteria bacterium]|nr:hypothetical protein [Alphaproteobacteria bacterium]
MQKTTKYTYIPNNYSELLSELKTQAFNWEINFSSRTENKTIGHISHYSINDTPASNCLILIPGLASNTRTEPLMKVIEYWALANQYDIYCIDTFLGDFLPETSQELAEKHTFAEYINLIDTGLEVIEKDVRAKKYNYSCVIGHSAGATGTFEIYNKRIQENKKLRFSASIMFAPYITQHFSEYIQRFYKHFSFGDKISEQEFKKSAITLISPHEPQINNQYQKISILPTFYDDVGAVKFCPELMDKYGIPITLVAGGRDKKSPPDQMYQKYSILRKGQNGHLWKYVVFKDSRHSFIEQHKDCGAILRLIQSQKQRAQKERK